MADDHSAPPSEPSMSDEEFDALIDSLPQPPEPTEAELVARDAQALADYEAGRWVSHEAVLRWVKSWGTDNPLPGPKWGE